MLTHQELEAIRRENTRYVRSIARMLTRAQAHNDPRQLRSVELAIARLAHTYHSVAKDFNKICQTQKKNGYMRQVGTLRQTLDSKYVPTALSMLQVLRNSQIPLDRWILAQAECLNMQHFTLFHCYGYNAQVRYDRWEARQEKKYLLSSERKAQTESKDRGLVRSIAESHQTALTWAGTLKEIQAPSLSLALWYLWPAVSVWYVLAHDEFRADIMETGLCTAPLLVKHWRSFSRSPHVQKVCDEALRTAETMYGKLSW